jgi:hypothetical protein
MKENEMDDEEILNIKLTDPRTQLIGALFLYALENQAEEASSKAVHLWEGVKQVEEMLEARGEPFVTQEQLGISPEQLRDILLGPSDEEDEQTERKI